MLSNKNANLIGAAMVCLTIVIVVNVITPNEPVVFPPISLTNVEMDCGSITATGATRMDVYIRTCPSVELSAGRTCVHRAPHLFCPKVVIELNVDETVKSIRKFSNIEVENE